MLLKYNQPRPDLSQAPAEKIDPLKVMRALQQARAVSPIKTLRLPR